MSVSVDTGGGLIGFDDPQPPPISKSVERVSMYFFIRLLYD